MAATSFRRDMDAATRDRTWRGDGQGGKPLTPLLRRDSADGVVDGQAGGGIEDDEFALLEQAGGCGLGSGGALRFETAAVAPSASSCRAGITGGVDGRRLHLLPHRASRDSGNDRRTTLRRLPRHQSAEPPGTW
jgi:hypothetical protein